MRIENLIILANRFEKMVKNAQIASAQAGDIERILKNAGLFDISQKVAPLLNNAKIPDDTNVSIDIVVRKDLNVDYMVKLNPENNKLAGILAGLVKKQFSTPMKKALIDAKISVSDVVGVKWLVF